MIINTHTHGDHTGSNMFFPASVEVVTHENTKANMEKMPVYQDPANTHGMPDLIYEELKKGQSRAGVSLRSA